MASMATQRSPYLNAFLRSLASAEHRVLFCDYDGTLAPFTADRSRALPYAEVPRLLKQLGATNTRLVITSGRVARQVLDFLPGGVEVEIWGSHGFERLLPTGECVCGPFDRQVAQTLAAAHEALVAEGLEELIETKLSGIAVHWRGLKVELVREVSYAAERSLALLADESFCLTRFDGGIELCIRGVHKGRAVDTVMREMPPGTVAAYLGDDLTDEDGFLAIRQHGLGILVCQVWRPSAAQMWLRPPEELTDFLNEWIASCGGAG